MLRSIKQLLYLIIISSLWITDAESAKEPTITDFNLSGRLYVDSRFHDHPKIHNTDTASSQSDIEIRSMRIQIDGGSKSLTRYKFSVENSSGKPNVKDGYLDVRLTDSFLFRAGQFHVPFGNESLGSSRFRLFQENSSISEALSASRDRGLMLHGHYLNNHAFFQIAYMNGSGANVSDDNDKKDIATRLVFNPFFNDTNTFNFWIGFSYTGGEEFTTKSKSLNIETESYSGYTLFNSKIPEGETYKRNRYDVEYTLLLGPFMLKGEMMRTTYFLPKAFIEGGYVATGYILTGEPHKIKEGLLYRQKTKEEKNVVGIAMRYSWYYVSNAFYTSNALYPGWEAVSQESNYPAGEAITFALNWYITPKVRFLVNYISSYADLKRMKGLNRPAVSLVETSLTSRLQVEF